jgi:hypothetical protein
MKATVLLWLVRLFVSTSLLWTVRLRAGTVLLWTSHLRFCTVFMDHTVLNCIDTIFLWTGQFPPFSLCIVQFCVGAGLKWTNGYIVYWHPLVMTVQLCVGTTFFYEPTATSCYKPYSFLLAPPCYEQYCFLLALPCNEPYRLYWHRLVVMNHMAYATKIFTSRSTECDTQLHIHLYHPERGSNTVGFSK